MYIQNMKPVHSALHSHNVRENINNSTRNKLWYWITGNITERWILKWSRYENSTCIVILRKNVASYWLSEGYPDRHKNRAKCLMVMDLEEISTRQLEFANTDVFICIFGILWICMLLILLWKWMNDERNTQNLRKPCIWLMIIYRYLFLFDFYI